ncbi:MAG: hypothetical protein JXQ93_14110, partial [Flavobacteriaceae bacterium]
MTKYSNYKILFFATLLLFSIHTSAQVCDELIAVCGNQTQQEQNATDPSPFTIDTGCSTPFSSQRTLWYRIKIAAGTRLTFTINPLVPADYDWALYGPNPDCSLLTRETAIRASYAGGDTATGASVDPAYTDTCENAGGDRFVRYVDVNPGEEYILVVDRFSATASEFDLIWNIDENGDPLAGSQLDCSIVDTALGPDQEVCVGTQVDLDATPTSGVAISYVWSVDTGSGFSVLSGEVAPILSITNNLSGNYKVEITDDNGNVAEDEVLITFFEQPVANALADPNYEICDDDFDGVVSFDLQTLFATEILGGQDPTVFEVLFFASQADADGNMNALPNPYTNTNQTETIYARVHTILSPTTCNIATTSFNISVDPLPVVQNPTDYEFCDDTIDGDDTNGIVQNFVLGDRDVQILGGLSASDYDIAYYLNATDADTEMNAIDKITPYQNLSREQEIFVVVTNIATTCKRKSVLGNPNFGTLTLRVNELPVVTTPVSLSLCDNDQDGITSFDLTTANSLISTDFINLNFSYYPSLVDAQNETNLIVNFNAYPNVTPNTDKVWARVTTINGCLRIAEIDLIVSTSVIPTTFQRSYNSCDDYDGTVGSDLDGITNFDFSAVNAEIIAEFPAAQAFTISHYSTLGDALANINMITDISNYRNITANTQQIYTRIDNTVNTSCLYIGTHITLNVNPVPTATDVNNMQLCDDDLDGDDTNGMVSFPLSNQTATILGGQDPVNFTVTYHASASDANSGLNNLPDSYSNTAANQQTIYVRVTNNSTGCFTDHTTFDLIVHPLPVISNV